MYGQIHCIVREMIQIKFGMSVWYQILEKSGLDEDSHFLVFSVYEDEVTLKLIGTVAEVLGITIDATLKEFGTYFLTYCLKHGYDKMLLTLGSDVYSFVQNLDSLHSMLSLSYRGIVSPSFRCVENEDGSLTIHHYSVREGFYPIVVGLVEAVGRELFNQNASLNLVSSVKEEVGPNKFQWHTTMQVILENRDRGGGLISGTSGDPTRPKIGRWQSSLDLHSANKGTDAIPKVEDMAIAFPYHLVVDKEMIIRQCGENIRRLVPFPITDATTFNEIGVILQPSLKPTSDRIRDFINSVFMIRILTGDSSKPFVMRGQFIWMKYCRHLMFMGSPRLQSLNDFTAMNVFLSDIPLYDCTRELVLLNQQRIAEIDVAKRLDETTIALKKTSNALEIEKHRTEELLHEMMPKKVARQLREYGVVKAEKYEWCTVLFSDIVTFTDITVMCEADQVVNMLNDMYRRFDTHTDAHDVYKVETIGDAYMAVTGVPEVQEDHAERMAEFAMDMVEEAGNVFSPATGLPLQIRVGFHSGPVVAGVIGKKKPRYDIYGDTVNTASRMESNSVPGRIHVSNSAFEKLYNKDYVFKKRGEIEVKGKGKMKTYFLVGTMYRQLGQPEDKFTFLPDVLNPEREGGLMKTKTPRASPAMEPPQPVNVVNYHGTARKSVLWNNLTEQLSTQGNRKLVKATASRSKQPAQGSGKGTSAVRLGGSKARLPDHHTETWNLSPPPPSAVGLPGHHTETWNLSPPPPPSLAGLVHDEDLAILPPNMLEKVSRHSIGEITGFSPLPQLSERLIETMQGPPCVWGVPEKAVSQQRKDDAHFAPMDVAVKGNAAREAAALQRARMEAAALQQAQYEASAVHKANLEAAGLKGSQYEYEACPVTQKVSYNVLRPTEAAGKPGTSTSQTLPNVKRQPSVLRRVQQSGSPFMKTKPRKPKPSKFQPYSTKQENLLPLSPLEESESASFLDKLKQGKSCVIL